MFTRTALVIVLVGLIAQVGCHRDRRGGPDEATRPPGESTDRPGAFRLTADSFADGGAVPARHTGEGDDASPALCWENVPPGTRELALVVDDPDTGQTPWVHWVIYRIPAGVTDLPAGLPRSDRLDAPGGALQGRNSWPRDNVGYRGPMPPPGSGVHHYRSTLYALDATLSLEPGLTKTQLLTAMAGHVLATARLVGTYRRD